MLHAYREKYLSPRAPLSKFCLPNKIYLHTRESRSTVYIDSGTQLFRSEIKKVNEQSSRKSDRKHCCSNNFMSCIAQ